MGGLCPSCKIQRGGLCPSCKIHGGDFVHVYKNEQGGFVRGGGGGGILSYTPEFHITLHNVPHDSFFQKCINGLVPPNRRTVRTPDKKSFKRHLLNH